MKTVVVVVAGAAAVLASGLGYAQSGAELAKSKQCVACHEQDKKKVGPAVKDIAAKYKGKKEAEVKLVAALKEGKGHPAKIAATDAELKTLVQYMLAEK